MKLIMVIAIILVSGCTNRSDSNPKSEKSEIGRYQLVQLGSFRRDQYLLDTQTGKLWTSECWIPGKTPPDCRLNVWNESLVYGLTHSPEQIHEIEQAMKKK